MGFENYDFSRCEYRVDKLPDKADIFEAYPNLSIYKEFKAKLGPGVAKDRIMRYIFCLYQKNTPLITIENSHKRKLEAANLCNFSKISEKQYHPTYKKIIDGTHSVFNKMVIRFIRIQKDHEFSQLVIYDELYYQSLLELKEATGTEGFSTQERVNIMKNVDVLKDKITKIKEKILEKDTSKEIDEELLDELENEQLELSPEDIAKKIMNEEDALNGFKVYE